jgi:hypothetical protein
MVAEQVLRLEVPMEVVLLVHVGKSLQCLEHDVPDHKFWKQLFALLHQLIDVHVQELKNKVQRAAVQYHFIQLDDVWMTELHQRLNLLLVNALVPLGILLFHSFDGNNLTYRHWIPL